MCRLGRLAADVARALVQLRTCTAIYTHQLYLIRIKGALWTQILQISQFYR